MPYKEKETERPLTEAEARRRDAFAETCRRMEQEGYRYCDLTVGMLYANVMALVLGLPIVAVLGTAYWAWSPGTGGTAEIDLGTMLLICGGFLLLTVAHEAIHGLTWSFFAQSRWKAISFGFITRYCTPYCTCQEPLTRGQYIFGGLMPTIVLGLLPAIAAIIAGSLPCFVVGALMILAGGGDLTIVLKLLRFREGTPGTVYLDHPYLCGLAAFVPEQKRE